MHLVGESRDKVDSEVKVIMVLIRSGISGDFSHVDKDEVLCAC
jgi:hypothetical protein